MLNNKINVFFAKNCLFVNFLVFNNRFLGAIVELLQMILEQKDKPRWTK